MEGWLLQDWVTTRGLNAAAGGITAIAQGAEGWIDVGDYEDLAFILDVREITNPSSPNLKLVYETAPLKQEASFRAMLTAFTPVVGQRVDRIFSSVASVPPARFVRWRLQSNATSATAYDLTFRVFVSAYAWVRV